MERLSRFAGLIVGGFIGLFDLIAILGMPWEPDLASPRDRWAIAIVGLLGLVCSFCAGWWQRGRDHREQTETLRRQIGELERTIGELTRQETEEERRLAELRVHVTRAYNLISQLNRPEAKSLRSLVDGNNQLVVTDPGTTGLLALGAIKYLADTGSYVSGRGELGYFAVSPMWRLYADWERELLDQRADSETL